MNGNVFERHLNAKMFKQVMFLIEQTDELSITNKKRINY